MKQKCFSSILLWVPKAKANLICEFKVSKQTTKVQKNRVELSTKKRRIIQNHHVNFI
jgi:hypothetical protein